MPPKSSEKGLVTLILPGDGGGDVLIWKNKQCQLILATVIAEHSKFDSRIHARRAIFI